MIRQIKATVTGGRIIGRRIKIRNNFCRLMEKLVISTATIKPSSVSRMTASTMNLSVFDSA
jgi:uncharacterized protein (DUF3084 family)